MNDAYLRCHPRHRHQQFKSRIEAELRAILEPRGLHYDLISVDDAPIIGAAVAGLIV